ncbi:hypothetical protein [Candidatus Korobacter versatilis]|uniref:hypothetical protein n=1 Tax=Candidatus Korobacter versatilis TaxID=658062 RepID=UPI0002F0E2EA|nr:hypothetical protein [Candidatus Koribacter versatilis]
MDPNAPKPDASANVAEAQSLLKSLREQVAHPDLDVAIEKLEMALSILTTKTGGML